jgi:hypothetical protein
MPRGRGLDQGEQTSCSVGNTILDFRLRDERIDDAFDLPPIFAGYAYTISRRYTQCRKRITNMAVQDAAGGGTWRCKKEPELFLATMTLLKKPRRRGTGRLKPF